MSEVKDEDIARVQSALDTLGEHFDSVQIFASRCEMGESDGTIHIALGTGNWFARYGQVRDWAIKQDEVTRLKARKDHNDP